jgi:hypothetical protein
MSKPADEVKVVPPDDDRPGDLAAPVAGGEVRDLNWNTVLSGMDHKARAKVSKKLFGAHPDVRKANRDRVRLRLAIFLIVTVIVDCGVALVLAVNKTISWGDLGVWLSLASVPLTPGIAAAIAFWYPTKEIP